jgi:diguanylate cyclase
MKYIRTLILFIIITMICIYSYKNKHDAILDNFVEFSNSTQYTINQNIKLSSDFIDLMSTYGDVFYTIAPKKQSELISKLTYQASNNTYTLDSIKGTEYEKFIGNLTGLGPIPKDEATRYEITLAFQYNNFFHNFYGSLPSVAWIYYTSKNKFINIYPWVSSKDFIYTSDIQKKEFYTMCLPENNPGRTKIWTPVYLDLAGKGLMITVSSPIYDHNVFKGSVSVDFTLNHINSLLEPDYDTFLLNNFDQIIATNKYDLSKFDNVKLLASIFPKYTKEELNSLKKLKLKTINTFKGNHIYVDEFKNTPFKMYFVLPEGTIIIKSVLYSLPILIIGILLLISTLETESRKKTEKKLKHTVDELNSFQELLKSVANLDYLTNTFNRRGMTEKISEEVARYNRTTNPFSFVICDIDHFKNFNDQYGHSAGDRVLIEIANTLKKHLRRTDYLCRWGGEEFLIMLCNSNYDDAIKVAENFRQGVEALNVNWEKDTILKVTMTFGVCEYDPTIGYETTISNVDAALYEGKNSGRNKVVGFKDMNN